MATTDCIDEVTHLLEGLKPHWLPAYDMKAYARKVDEECGFTSETMVAMHINQKMFEEAVAFVQLCGAFGWINPSDAQQYVRIRDDRDEIDNALASHVSSTCPTYTGLLALFVERGMLALKSSAPWSADR